MWAMKAFWSKGTLSCSIFHIRAASSTLSRLENSWSHALDRSMPNPTSWGNPLLRLRLNRFERFGFFFALSLRFTTRWESVSVSVWMDCSVPQEYMATNRNANFCLLFFTRQQRGNRGTLKIGFLTSALRLRLFTYIFPCLANKHDS